MGAKNVYTISPLYSFADTLCAHLLNQNAGTPEKLAKTVIFLPTRRACRTMHEAFLRQSGGKALLLPRLVPFGSIADEDGEALSSFFTRNEDLSLPPSISPLRRRLLLTRLIQQRRTDGLTAQKALKLADALALFLDESYIESVPFDVLHDLVPEEFAAHWQETLSFLEIVTLHWPDILKADGVIDESDRQVRLFNAQANAWRQSPPDFQIIAAGSTGSQPATAELLDAIAGLPDGKVILPGLDMISSDEDFAAVEPSHPQYNLKKLIEKMGVSRSDIKQLCPPDADEGNSERLRLLTETMRPASKTDQWRQTASFKKQAVDGLYRLDCETESQEAATIALILREVLETPAKTAALVTPDRSLARRVIAQMKRFGVTLDDSAGERLTTKPLGAFLTLLVKAALSDWAPFDLLACLKHPLAGGGMEYGRFRGAVRHLENTVLRGKRPAKGLKGLRREANEDAAATELIDLLQSETGDFTDLMRRNETFAFADLLNAHLTAAENLAKTTDRSGAARLWADEAGETASLFFTELKEQADIIAPVTPAEYADLFATLLSGVTVRSKYGMHPRLDILGTLEARLIRPDVLILGGLNEGVWPKTPAADPWMSRPMRKECGLSDPERKIALSAHDFAQAFCAPSVVLTRSLKTGGTPSIPSRWLLRLDTVLKNANLSLATGPWLSWAKKQDAPPVTVSFRPPQPVPPVAFRPRKLSVTRVETLMRDPYSIYAGQILKLKPAEDIDKTPDQSDYGTLAHKAVQLFCEKYQTKLPADPYAEITSIGDGLLAELNLTPYEEIFWKPKVRAALCWFIDEQKKRVDGLAHILCEQKGKLSFETANGSFTLTCSADRIDSAKDGTVTLIDYKTGMPPSDKMVFAGYSPQLPLETAILKADGFERVRPSKNVKMEYWRLKGKADGGLIREVQADATILADDALERLKDLIASYDNPETPYLATPDTSVAPAYNDYDHLARFAEWATRDDSESKDDDDDD